MLDVMEIDIDRPEKIVYVVGLGPGGGQFLTVQAQSFLYDPAGREYAGKR